VKSFKREEIIMIIQLIEILRIAIVCIAFYIGYDIGFQDTYDPVAQLHFMIPIVVFAIAAFIYPVLMTFKTIIR